MEYTSVLPENHVEGGARARVGYVARDAAFEGGILAWTDTLAGGLASRPSRRVRAAPDIVFHMGSRTNFVELGFGSYGASTIRYGGIYLQGGLALTERWSSTLAVGIHGASWGVYHHMRMDL